VAVPATLEITTPWHELLDTDHTRAQIERECLRPFLLGQRWYSGKARDASTLRVADWGVLTPGETPSFVLFVDVTFTAGGRDRFLVLAGTAAEAGGRAIAAAPPASLMARLSGPRPGFLHGHVTDADASALLGAIEASRTIPLRHGRVRGQPTSAFNASCGAPARTLAVRRPSAEQSNTSIVYGDRLILKLIRRLEPGLNPDYEIGHHLTERVGFDRVPRLAGALDYVDADGTRTILGVLQRLVPHRANAWEHTLELAGAFYERVAGLEPPAGDEIESGSPLATGIGPPPAAMEDAARGAIAMAGLLGLRTAEMHHALATPAGDPAFEPEPLGREGRVRLARDMAVHGHQALDALETAMTRLPATLAAMARRILGARGALVARFDEIAQVDPLTPCVRVHGDYHLGQVLWDGTDVTILDFEGEPLRPIEERRRKHPPAKDVAGMLRSYSYAAEAALAAHVAAGGTGREAVDPWARAWQSWNAAAFLHGYVGRARDAGLVSSDAAAFEGLLRAFLLDKALYELLYELNNRPDWLRIPLQGILRLIR
jgi:maltose alpha-D-glucosyltransferase/alpha-amylase